MNYKVTLVGTINYGNQWNTDHLESFYPKEKEDESPSFLLLISSSNFSHPWEDSHLPPTTHFPSRTLQLECLFLMELEELFVHRAHFLTFYFDRADVWHRNKLRFASLEWCWWNHRKMTTEKGQGREENLSTALLSWHQMLWVQYLPLPTHSLSVNLFTCITQTFRCSQRPKFVYFPRYPRVIISVYIFLSLYLFSHC